MAEAVSVARRLEKARGPRETGGMGKLLPAAEDFEEPAPAAKDPEEPKWAAGNPKGGKK